MMNSYMLIILVPFAVALLSPVLGKVFKPIREVLTVLSSIYVLFAGVTLLLRNSNAVFSYNFLNVTDKLTFGFNALSLFFVVLIALGYFSVAIAEIGNAKVKERHGLFYFLFNLTAASLIGITAAKDLLSFFIFWEIMTWSSYFMVVMRTNRGGIKYIVFNVAGAYAMLLGILTVYGDANSFSFEAAKSAIALMSSYKAISVALLFSAGFLVKMGTMPLHVWAPDAYTDSPDNFSAFFSGVLSKAGVYGFLVFVLGIADFTKLGTVFQLKGISGYSYILAWLGVITSIIGTFKAIREDEMKRLLAYSSIAQVGYIVTAISIGTFAGLMGGLYHSLIHTILKLMLFITIAGVIERTGYTKFSELGALITKMPLSFITVLIGIIGLAGMPPMGGFSSKWIIYTSLIQGKFYFLLIGMIVSSTAAFLYCYKLIYGIFLGHPSKVKLEKVKEVSKPVWIPQIVLMVLLMVLGMFPGIVIPYLAKAVSVIGIKGVATSSSIYALSNNLGGFNGLLVMNVLGGVFVVALIFFTVATVKSRKIHRLDIYYSAEAPTEDTPLHYGNGIGAELHRIPVVGTILAKHITKFYNGFANQVEGVADLLRGIYNGNGQTYVLYSIIVLVLLMVFLGY